MKRRKMLTAGDLIRTVMLSTGVTQTELAFETGRPNQAINEMINGRKQITAESAKQIGTVLGIRPQVIMLLQAFDELGSI